MRDHRLADELAGSISQARAHFLLDGILARLEALHAEGRVLFGLHPGNVNISATDVITLVDTDLRPQPVAHEVSAANINTAATNIYAFGNILHEVMQGFEHQPEAEQLCSDCRIYQDASSRPTATQARRRLAALGWAGPVTPWQERFEPSDPKERDLIAALADDQARLVYADWLEHQGFGERAAFVRAELSQDPQREAAVASLAKQSDLLWRRAVSRARLLGCRRTNCPGRWDLMSPRDDTSRSCRTCDGEVTYCATQHAVSRRNGLGVIALDARVSYAWAHRQYNPPPPTWNPPPPTGNPPPPTANPPGLGFPPDPTFEPRGNPPPPHWPQPAQPAESTGVLARFFGWFKRDS